MSILCIYHIADNDGKGSAAIVKNLYPEADLFGFNHDMQVPTELIEKYQKIIVCDISLPLDYMFDLSSRKEFIWIDHHVSVINPYEAALAKGNYDPIKGLRRNGTAAIELTWEYFHPAEPVPEGVKLLALNDIFDLRDDRVRPFEYAFQSLGVNMPDDTNWTKLFHNELNIADMVEKGRAILSWIRVRNYRSVRSMSFESEFQGLKCICANMAYGYSEFYDSVENIHDYDFSINFYMNKNNQWNMTFYALKPNIDVSKIAAVLGGGGHKGAAGASAQKQLPEFLTKGKPTF